MKKPYKAVVTEKDKEISRNLKRIWKDHQYDTEETQKHFAERIGLKQPNLSAYIHGNQRIGAGVLMKIAAALSVSPRDIDPDF